MRREVALVLALGFGFGAAPARAITTNALLDTLQHSAFQYFWTEANPANGLVKDRNTPGSVSSIAATGFGLSAICIGADHGWITRTAAQTRVLTTLQTFYNGPQSSAANGTIGYQGLFYHWLDMNTARRTWDSELSTIDTALLFAGILDARQYFSSNDPTDVQIRFLADTLYRRANWNFARNFDAGIYMGWKPGTGFCNFGRWIGYNEAMILYVLAIGSPTKPIPPSQWNNWTSGYDWSSWYGQSFVEFAPLFGHQYSHAWIDFRDIQDDYMRSRGITYHENSRRASLAQHAYCVANPLGWVGYADSLWGITASDDPSGYLAHGAPPAESENGTIAPTAALSSIVFTPEYSIPFAHKMWNTYRTQGWGPYGFTDAFNLTQDWWGSAVLGIDQGPILLMIENHRTGAVWNRFMQNADIQRGLTLAGFTPVTTGVGGEVSRDLRLALVSPNPGRGAAQLRYRLGSPGRLRLEVFDVAGRLVEVLAEGDHAAGEHSATFRGDGLPGGLYLARLQAAGQTLTQRIIRLR